MSKVWKWLFLGLLALNLALISVVTVRIMTPVEMSPVSLPKGAAKIGKYSMSKEELDASLRGFAQDYSTDKMRFMRNIWMFITSRRKNEKRKYRSWSRRKSI